MSEPSSSKLPAQLAELLTFLHERQEKRGNCTMKDRAELWLRYGGEQMDISPPNFHHALATGSPTPAWSTRKKRPMWPRSCTASE